MSSIAHGCPSMVYLLMVRWMKAGRPHESCCRNPNSCQPQLLACVALVSSMSLRQDNRVAAEETARAAGAGLKFLGERYRLTQTQIKRKNETTVGFMQRKLCLDECNPNELWECE